MQITRREILAGATALGIYQPSAIAQAYPSRNVLLSVGFAAGGGTDLVARLLANQLSRKFGQQFVVENTTGMGGNLSIERVFKAASDGYTLLFAAPNSTIGASLYKKLPFDFKRDFVGIAPVMHFPNVMVVSPSLGTRSVAEFIAYAKDRAGALSYGSSGHGTSLHLCGALFCQMAGLELTHVPYRGSHAAYPDLIAGRIQVMFDNITIALAMVRAEKVRALGVTAAERWASAAHLPAISETLPGFEAMVWYGLVGRREVPSPIVSTLNAAVLESVNESGFGAKLADTGGQIMRMNSQEFQQFLEHDIDKWRKVVDLARVWVQ